MGNTVSSKVLYAHKNVSESCRNNWKRVAYQHWLFWYHRRWARFELLSLFSFSLRSFGEHFCLYLIVTGEEADRKQVGRGVRHAAKVARWNQTSDSWKYAACTVIQSAYPLSSTINLKIFFKNCYLVRCLFSQTF